MSYLLWQIFMCLLGTAIIFFALGWLLRNFFKGRATTDNLIADAERMSWQTSLDGLKARLDAETGRKIAAEKALADAKTQHSEIATVLDQRDGDVNQLEGRVAELESQHGGSADLVKERDALSAQLAALTELSDTRGRSLNAANADLEKRLTENKTLKAQASENAPKLTAALAAGAELIALRARVADLEPKLKATAADATKQLVDRDAAIKASASENEKLKDQIGQLQAEVSELTPKLAMAAAAGSEVIALKAHVAQLEPQVSKLQSSDAELGTIRSQLADLQQKLQASTDEVSKLKSQEAELNKKLSIMQSNSADATKHLADLDANNKSFADDTHRLKAHITELEAKLHQHNLQDIDSAKQLKAHSEESQHLKTQLAAAVAASAEIIHLKSHIVDLESSLSRSKTMEAEVVGLRKRVAEIEPQMIERNNNLHAAADEQQASKTRITELESKLHQHNLQDTESAKQLKAHEEETQHLKTQLAAATAAAGKIVHLKSQISDLEGKLAKTHTHESELSKLRARFAEVEPQLADRDAKLRTAHDELTSFKRRWVEHEGKFQAVGEENARLKAQMAEYEPKLKQAQQHDGELTTLRIRIDELEPQLQDRDSKLHNYNRDNHKLRIRVEQLEPELDALQTEVQTLRLQLTSLQPQIQDWETRYQKTVAQKDEELSQCRSRVAELDEKLSHQNIAPQAAAVHDATPPKGERDDLKKIFGIGPVLEKRLHALGVYYFRDIAGWSKEDILRYEEHLKEFRDRIERDHWVEGAREQHFKKYGEMLLKAAAAGA